eukprot:TRINITY_DN13693_c0_g1_i3.p1 TRINITY_DN13693_c0_g1~~TRINITY_DN13693_c0_g1_i3.p1  ORF type:complete len:365 (-),score=36.87 TRINITY_DN13693_c0_g1_i3:981-2075(-)
MKDTGRLEDGIQPLLEKSSSRKARFNALRGGDAVAIICTLVVALGPLQFGYMIGYSSPNQSAITEDLELSVSQYSLVGSLPNVGAMVGAIASGRIADQIGRNAGLTLATVPGIAGWLLITFTKNVLLMYVGRLLTGIATGIISFIAPVYISEIAPTHLRGLLGTVNQLSITTGIMLAYLLGLLFSWRLMAIIGVVPCALLIVGLRFVPESPRWLAQKGKEADFVAALQVLRGRDADISLEESEIKTAVETQNEQDRIRLAEVLQKRYAVPLVLGIGLLVLQQFSGINGVMFYGTSIFKSVGVSSSKAVNFILGAIQVAMTAFTAWLMDRAGRRLLLMVTVGCTSINTQRYIFLRHFGIGLPIML